MDARTRSLDEFLGAVLRGAAKLLGCGSTNLILINEKSQEIRIRLGTMAGSYPMLAELEHVLGGTFNGISFPVRQAQDSLVYRSWRDCSILETSSLAELVGSALQRPIVLQMTQLIGHHRFICVPALSAARSYGVLLFQKEGRHPFSRQQREVILRYARRIGEILENDLMGQGQMVFSRLPSGGPGHLLLDDQGQIVGQGPPGSAALAWLLGRGEVVDHLAARARAFVAGLPGVGPEVDSAALSLDVDLDLELFPLEGGGSARVLCVVHRRSGKRDASLENQLLQLTLGEAVPALFVDPEFRITSCNAATEPILGYSPSELVGRAVGQLFRDAPEIVRILSQQILDPTSPRCEEAVIIRRKDGSLAPARVEALLLASDRHEAVGFLVVLRETRDPSRDAPERLVRQERLATMGEMAAQLAHEMRNPIVAIGATLETLVRDSSLDDAHRTILASVAKEIVRMDMTLKDYLAFRHDLSFTEVAVAQVVEDARLLLEGAYKLAQKRITSRVEPDLVIRADYEAMKHVLFNLLLNALQASPIDGEVTCGAAAGEHDVSIVVEDRGPGLAASAAECLQPFFTTKKNGTGLGLTVCAKIARAHGGLIDLRNREGGGCRAAVVLPRPAAVAATFRRDLEEPR
jgi:PAS domain S-box-containing protein